MTRLFAGIDGGQSSTVAAIGDERGRILARGAAGPADEVGQGSGSTRMHDALDDALRAALAHAKLPDETHFEAIVAGVSGYEGRVYGKVPQLRATRFVLMHDAPIAHAGALAGEAGIVVIAGTGSVVYATDGARGWTLGGWGYLFGDEGSAFWFAREKLAGLMKSQDWGMESKSAEEVQKACDFFGLPSLRAVARAFYAGELSRERVAAFASVDLTSEASWSSVTLAATYLSWLVREAVVKGAPARVALVGGMFSNDDYAREVRAHLKRWLPELQIVEPRFDPAAGALLLAYREAGIEPMEIPS